MNTLYRKIIKLTCCTCLEILFQNLISYLEIYVSTHDFTVANQSLKGTRSLREIRTPVCNCIFPRIEIIGKGINSNSVGWACFFVEYESKFIVCHLYGKNCCFYHPIFPMIKSSEMINYSNFLKDYFLAVWVGHVCFFVMNQKINEVAINSQWD